MALVAHILVLHELEQQVIRLLRVQRQDLETFTTHSIYVNIIL